MNGAGAVVISDGDALGSGLSRTRRTAALVAGWVALVLALLPFGLFLVTKIGHALAYPYVLPLYALLVAIVIAVNRLVRRGDRRLAGLLTGVAVVGGVAVFGFFSWPSIAALVLEVSLAKRVGTAPGRSAATPNLA